MSLVTLQRSTPDTSKGTQVENTTKQIDFDKEFNFHDLKEIYDERKQFKNALNKPAKIFKSTSHVKVNVIEPNSNYNENMNDNNDNKIRMSTSTRQLFEKYFLVKDAALILPRRVNKKKDNSNNTLTSCDSIISNSTDSDSLLTKQGQNDSVDSPIKPLIKENLDAAEITTVAPYSGDILKHLQSMVQLLRPTDTISVAVKLCSYHTNRARYLVVVETPSNRFNSSSEVICEESAILGLDLQLNKEQSEELDENLIKTNLFPVCSVGLVIPIYANCEISLSGDGGFKFKTHQSTHIFKPVSIQAMWSAYIYLHKVLENSRKHNFYSVVPSSISNSAQNSLDVIQNNQNQDSINNSLIPINHEWVKHYTAFIGKNKMDQQNLNEWYQKEDRSAQREEFTTPYFDQICLTKEQEETGSKIKDKLKEIMINSKDDYGAMSSIHIRRILEKELQLNLDNYKKFVDVTIFQFYNQLIECASQILPFVYLGTEWNASNYDSLVSDGITHILNVSSDVDNFFPDNFTYLNIRVRDVDETDLLKEFDRTNKFIQEVRDLGTSCLVHCKMGVSRSASVVLAYLMKEYNYSLEYAFNFTKQKRTCINPNDGFRVQLATYESILNAHRSKYNLFEPSVISPTTRDGLDYPSPPITEIPVLVQTENTSEAPMNASDDVPVPVDKCTQSTSEKIQSTLSVKEAINKIKSLSSIETQILTSQATINVSPPLSPKQLKKLHRNSMPVKNEEIPEFIYTKSVSNSPNLKRTKSHLTTQYELNKNTLNLPVYQTSSTSSIKANESTKQGYHNHNHHYRSKSNTTGVKKRDDIIKTSLSHAESDPTQISNENSHNKQIVKKLANEYMSKEFRSLPNDILKDDLDNFADVENISSIKSARFSLNLTSSTSKDIYSNKEEDEDLNGTNGEGTYVPIGIVKRQVESINFKSRPCTPSQNDSINNFFCDENIREANCESLILSENRNSFLTIEPTTFTSIENSLIEIQNSNKFNDNNYMTNKQQQQQAITRSPDSKRFKWEYLNIPQYTPAEFTQSIGNNTELISIDQQSPSSKKVFEFLAEKQRKKEAETSENNKLIIANNATNNGKKVLFLGIEIKPYNSNNSGSESSSASSSASSLMSSSLILNINNNNVNTNSNEISNCQAV